MEGERRDGERFRHGQVRVGGAEEESGGGGGSNTNSCDHVHLLDDYQTADCICTDCGLVVDRIIGVDPSKRGPVVRMSDDSTGGWQSAGEAWKRFEDMRPSTAGHNGGSFGLRWIEYVMGELSLGGDYLMPRVLDNFAKIYSDRAILRKTDEKMLYAVAFSVLNVSGRECMPRPPQYVLRLCGLNEDNMRPLLNIDRTLLFSKKELESIPSEYYTLSASSAEDYIDTVCAFLNIKYRLATEMYELAAESAERFPDKKPTAMAAACALIVLEGHLGSTECSIPIKSKQLCDLLDVNFAHVQRLARSVRNWKSRIKN